MLLKVSVAEPNLEHTLPGEVTANYGVHPRGADVRKLGSSAMNHGHKRRRLGSGAFSQNNK
jgi:hypothetical protein